MAEGTTAIADDAGSSVASLSDELANCRRAIIVSGLLARPPQEDAASAFLRVLSRAKRRQRGGGNADAPKACGSPNGGESPSDAPKPPTPASAGCADPACFKAAYWIRAAAPLKQPLLIHTTDSARSAAVKFSAAIHLVERATSLDEPAVVRTVQAVLQRCLESDRLTSELFLQLVRQTYCDSPDGLPATAPRPHQLLCAACSLIRPTWEPAMRLLRCHLTRLSRQQPPCEPARCAQFCLACLARPARPSRRRFPPSAAELSAAFACANARVLVNLLNGESRQLEFHSHLTGAEATAAVISQVPLKPSAAGWALFEQFPGAPERCTGPAEFIGDALFRWEQHGQLNGSPHLVRLLLKKRLFISPYVDESDDIEVSLMAHQCLTNVFEGHLPLTLELAKALCGIQSAREATTAGTDPALVRRILPRRWRDRVPLDAILTAASTASAEAAAIAPKEGRDRHRALDLQLLAACRSASPLFGCTVFSARLHSPLAAATASIGDACALAVGEAGLQILPETPSSCNDDGDVIDADWRRTVPLVVFVYPDLLGFGSDSRAQLSLQLRGQGRLSLHCRQANQAAHLIRDYLLAARQQLASASDSAASTSSAVCTSSAIVHQSGHRRRSGNRLRNGSSSSGGVAVAGGQPQLSETETQL